MFAPGSGPRIFASAPGVDFAGNLVAGLLARTNHMTPDALARVVIYVNTARMQRRIRTVFDTGPARLLPQVRLITDLAQNPIAQMLPPAVPPLQRRLELAQLIARLLEKEPDLAPKTALYDLSDSLARLMDEMYGEGVHPQTICDLDVSDQSGHWDRALKFLRIIIPFFDHENALPDQEARQRIVITALAERWVTAPPAHPVIVAGSTGSRGATALFMQAVARLPQGAIILPGFDSDLPGHVWAAMDDDLVSEDHPQFRFRKLMDLIGFTHNDVQEWGPFKPPDPARNALISLSLRPAPVTNQWRRHGKDIGDLTAATAGLTLLEAGSPRAEAETIALRLRQAAEDGVTAALISPDRILARQVTAALDRWGITPDDSAGTPLAQSPPGRFLRHTADLFGKTLTTEALLIILKHPLCHAGRDDRGTHLRQTRDLELYFRQKALPFPSGHDLRHWAGSDATRKGWVSWICDLIRMVDDKKPQGIAQNLQNHLAVSERFCAGPDTPGAGTLWDGADGRAAKRICDDLAAAAHAGGQMTAREYATFFGSLISEGVVRDRDAGHPGILIWGALEARVQGVGLTILAGMNDGTWPKTPAPDLWLNRVMRAKAGLLLPERRIGLSAHDYQQAVAGQEVWITRAKRSADAETVPSRWVNRLTNLLNGLPDQNGPEAYDAMRQRGAHWAALANALATPQKRLAPATRPSPCPPVAARPKKMSVTQIKTLIRDPFAVYARMILRIDPLDPLVPVANPALRGTIVHNILEIFLRNGHGAADRDALLEIARDQFEKHCPWPTPRAQWVARLDQIADQFLAGEALRQTKAVANMLEVTGEIILAPTCILLTGKADRIDLTEHNTALIYDYKTGQVPTKAQQQRFDKQLLVEAAMVERGAFTAIGSVPVADARFIAVNTAMRDVAAPLDETSSDTVWAGLETLFEQWARVDRGYTARLALFLKDDHSPYDHLSRYGEWDTSDLPEPQILT